MPAGSVPPCAVTPCEGTPQGSLLHPCLLPEIKGLLSALDVWLWLSPGSAAGAGLFAARMSLSPVTRLLPGRVPLVPAWTVAVLGPPGWSLPCVVGGHPAESP